MVTLLVKSIDLRLGDRNSERGRGRSGKRSQINPVAFMGRKMGATQLSAKCQKATCSKVVKVWRRTKTPNYISLTFKSAQTSNQSLGL